MLMNSLEKKFTDLIANESREVTIFLTNGVKLGGVVTYNSDDSLALTRDGISQLIYKHAIATIMPRDILDMTEFADLSE